MELQQLRYFVSVSKHRNFTRAAEECRVSQPALSIQIQKLEAELGGPLFHRQGRNITLTTVGQRLLERAESLLRLHQSTLDEVKDVVTTGGVSRFGATLTIAPYLLPYMVGHLTNEDLPAFHMEENFTENLLAKILDGSLDFALMSTPVEEPRLLLKVIAIEPFVFVLPKAHRLATQKKISLKDAATEPFLPLSHIHCAGRQIADFYRDAAQRMQTVFESAQIDTILKLVDKQQGITLLPKMAILETLSDELCFREVEGPKLEREISMVYHPDRYLSDSTRRLMQLVEAQLNEFVSSEGLLSV